MQTFPGVAARRAAPGAQGPNRGARYGLADRYRALWARHADLEARLSSETAQPSPDGGAMERLKRRIRLVKEELMAIERLLAAIGARVEDVLGRSGTGIAPGSANRTKLKSSQDAAAQPA